MNEALTRLRSKTDRELGILAEKQIEQTLKLAEEGRYRDAQHAYDTARLILLVAQLPIGLRVCLERKLKAAREAILAPISAVA